MFRKIFRESVQEILTIPSLVRVYFFLWFWQNVFVLYILVYRIFDVINSHYHLVSRHIPSIFTLPIELIKHNFAGIAILLAVCIFFWHFVLYPLAINSVIFRLENKKYTRGKIFWHFFSTVLLEWVFDIASTSLILYYAIQLETNNILLRTVIGIVIVVLEIFYILTPFAQYVILLENMETESTEKRVAIAINRSINIVLSNIGTTIKFTILQFFLRIRTIINILVVIGVPLGVGYLIYESNLLARNTMLTLMGTLGGILLLFVMYVDAFIDVFFLTFWYKLYKFLLQKESTANEKEENPR